MSVLEVKENECIKIMIGVMVLKGDGVKGNRNDCFYRMYVRKLYKFCFSF